MDLIKQQLKKLTEQFATLSATQRMLVAALVTIMAMTMFYWARYASVAEMEPVLDQPLSGEDMSRIKGYLSGKGYEVKVSGDRVMVGADRRLEALSDLTYSQLLPQDTTSGFDIIIKQMGPWDAASKNDVFFNEAKQITLAKIIRGWKPVANASVMIDQKEKRAFANSVTPSATVDIKTRSGGRPDKQLVRAAVALVRGAVASIDPSRVTVIVDGASQAVQELDGGALGGGGEMELRQASERYYADKIVSALGYIQGTVFVSVSVDVNTKASQQERTIVDAKGSFQKPIEEETKSDDSKSAAAAGGEPGVGSNTGATVADSGTSDKQNTSNSEEKVKYMVVPATTVEHVTEAPGKSTVKMASVRVPRSYFTRVYRELHPAEKDVDAAKLQPVIDEELPHIRDDVKKATLLADDTSVAVQSYVEASPPLAMAVESTASASGVTGMVGAHAKEIAVGVLAMISLFMVSMMVRKSSPAPALTAAAAGGATFVQRPGEMVAGEVGEDAGMLDGMELDEDAVKTQHMVGQVSTLVKENPEAAANLVKRWLNR